MPDRITLRETAAQDGAGLLALYPLAFPEEELRPLVSDLLADPSAPLSLGAYDGAVPIGHALFTPCQVAGRGAVGALLGPLAVRPDHRGRGIGGALIRDGCARRARAGAAQVFVLGDPDFYARFGFRREERVRPPYPLPAGWGAAWQSLTLGGRAALAAGPLILPAPWMRRALWSP